MQNKVKVLIGDNTNEFGGAILNSLSSEDFDVTLTGKNGILIWERIKEISPDIVIVDCFMPQNDAIGVMHEAQKNNMNECKFIVLNSYDNKFIEGEVMRNGATYYMIRPIDIKLICERICDISGTKIC